MRRVYGVLLSVLVLFSLACGFLGRASAPPEAEQLEPVPVSEEAAQQFSEKLKQAQAVQADETVTLTFTEEEVTSFIALNMPSEESGIENLQVHFRDGRIYITGSIKVGPSTQKLFVKIRPSVENGQVALEFEEATLGPISLPDPIKELISEQILAAFNTDNQRAEIKSIRVDEGSITIESVIRGQ